jgi:hypothetical protein
MAQLSGDSLIELDPLTLYIEPKKKLSSNALTTSIVFSTANGAGVTRVMAVYLLKNDIVGLLCRSEEKTRKILNYKQPIYFFYKPRRQ